MEKDLKIILNKLLTRDNIAELCRITETMINNRKENVFDYRDNEITERKDMPISVREYNKELILLDENILKILISLKKEIKKNKYEVYGLYE